MFTPSYTRDLDPDLAWLADGRLTVEELAELARTLDDALNKTDPEHPDRELIGVNANVTTLYYCAFVRRALGQTTVMDDYGSEWSPALAA